MDQHFRKHSCILITFLLLVLSLSAALFPLGALAASEEPEPTVILVVLEPGRTDTPIDLFLNAYGGTVLSDRTVIAPGTENAISVRFTEPHGVPFSYKAYVKAEVLQGGEPADLDLPLTVSVNGGEPTAFSSWFSDGDGILVSSGSLSAGKQGSVDFSWKWVFERGDDAGDVALSELKDLSAIVRVIVITEAEMPAETTEPDTTEATRPPESTEATLAPVTTVPDATRPPATTAAPKTPTKAPSRTTPSSGSRTDTPFGVDDSPLGIIVILSLALVAGVLLIILYKHRKTRNE